MSKRCLPDELVLADGVRGALRAYAEMVLTGAKPVAWLPYTLDPDGAAQLAADFPRLKVRVVPRVGTFLYRWPVYAAVIDELVTLRERGGVFAHWAWGKAMGYADADIQAFVARDQAEQLSFDGLLSLNRLPELF